ncbi:MAG TPA: hypothetical protein VHB79_36405 [Polyangiaceae bacterium]|nr:hypothetical protein [Polyangiaceae bacterium]
MSKRENESYLVDRALERAAQAVAVATAPGGPSLERLRTQFGDPKASLDDRVRYLTEVANLCCRAASWREGEQVARAAVGLAEYSGDSAMKALASLRLGTLMIQAFEHGYGGDEEDSLSAALAHLDGAAEIYESIGSLDFYPCLLAIARTLEICEDDPRGVYARITADLTGEKWEQASRQSPDLARHVDYLRGRAFLGLGEAELVAGNHTLAAERLSAARELLQASQAPDLAELLARIDEHARNDGGRSPNDG